MPDNPLCPECRKQMTPRYICGHCGYDDQRLRTTSLWKPTPLPYKCSKCGKPAGKLMDGIPVCGECFVAGWGRLPSMPLVKSESGIVLPDTTTVIPETIDAPLYVSEKPPKPKAAKRKSKPGGTRK